jgi:hypothetical protein
MLSDKNTILVLATELSLRGTYVFINTLHPEESPTLFFPQLSASGIVHLLLDGLVKIIIEWSKIFEGDLCVRFGFNSLFFLACLLLFCGKGAQRECDLKQVVVEKQRPNIQTKLLTKVTPRNQLYYMVY